MIYTIEALMGPDLYNTDDLDILKIKPMTALGFDQKR